MGHDWHRKSGNAATGGIGKEGRSTGRAGRGRENADAAAQHPACDASPSSPREGQKESHANISRGHSQKQCAFPVALLASLPLLLALQRVPFLEWTEWFSRQAGSLASCTAESRFVALNGVCVDGEKCRDPFVIQGDAIDLEDNEADEGNFISEHEKRGSIWKERKREMSWTRSVGLDCGSDNRRADSPCPPARAPRRGAPPLRGPLPAKPGDEGH